MGGVPKGAWVSGRCSGTITVHGDTLSGGLPHYLRKQVRWRRRTRGPKFARYVAQPQPCVCMYVCSSYSYQSETCSSTSTVESPGVLGPSNQILGRRSPAANLISSVRHALNGDCALEEKVDKRAYLYYQKTTYDSK